MRIKQQLPLILEQRDGVISSTIYLKGFSVFKGEKVVLNMTLKKGQKIKLSSLKSPRGSLQHFAP